MPPVRIQILASRPSCRPPLVTGYQPKSVVFRKDTRRKLTRFGSPSPLSVKPHSQRKLERLHVVLYGVPLASRKLTRRKLARVQSIIRVAESISSFGGRATVKALLAFRAFAVLITPPPPGTSSSVETSAPLT